MNGQIGHGVLLRFFTIVTLRISRFMSMPDLLHAVQARSYRSLCGLVKLKGMEVRQQLCDKSHAAKCRAAAACGLWYALPPDVQPE